MNVSTCIALVNFNGHADTIECLESIFNSTNREFQVVIVDNSSDSSSLEKIESWLRGDTTNPISTAFPEYVYPVAEKPLPYALYSEEDFLKLSTSPAYRVLLVRSEKNRGFAGGNNIALRYFLCTNFDFIWLLNNDTVIQPNTLEVFTTYARKSSEQIGMVGGKLFNYFERNRLQAVAARYYKWFGKVRELGNGTQDNGQWDNVNFRFDYIIGASMFIKKKFVESVGLMTEDYFIYYEELDWAIRGKRKNWKMSFCAGATVFHKLGASTGSGKKENSEISDFYSVRNRIIIAKRYFPLTVLTLYPAFVLFIIKRIVAGKPERVKILFRLLWNPWQHYTPKI